MSNLLTLLSETSIAPWDGDPGTLGPTEHYNELTWTGTSPDEVWTDAKSFSDGWPTEVSSRTSTTQNGLKCMISATDYWTSAGASVIPYSSLTNTNSHTAFYVAKWGGADNDTFQWATGQGAAEIYRQKSSSGNMYIQFQDASSESLINAAAFSLRSGEWDVWCIRLTNTTGAGILDTFHFQTAAVQATNASWTGMNLNGFSAGHRLLVNNTGTEPWAGTLAEIVVFNTALTNDECQSINAFLTTKWGITAP